MVGESGEDGFEDTGFAGTGAALGGEPEGAFTEADRAHDVLGEVVPATHDPEKILLDLAIAVAVGGDCLADIAMLRAAANGVRHDRVRPNRVTHDHNVGR